MIVDCFHNVKRILKPFNPLPVIAANDIPDKNVFTVNPAPKLINIAPNIKNKRSGKKAVKNNAPVFLKNEIPVKQYIAFKLYIDWTMFF